MADISPAMALVELERRGILPPAKVPVLAELRRRGLVPGLAPAPENIPLGETDPSMMQAPPPRGLLETVGSLGAGGAGLALGGPVAGYMANVGGAMAGSRAEDYMYGTPPEETNKNMVISGILAGIAPGVGGAAEKVGSAMSKGLKADALRALQFARANNLPIDVAEISPSWMATLFSGDLLAAGRYKTKQYAMSAEEWMVGARSKVLEKLTGAPETVGVPIADIKSKVAPALKEKTKEAYGVSLKIVDTEVQAAKKGWEASKFGDDDAMVRVKNMRTVAGELMGDARVQNAKPVYLKGKGMVSPIEWVAGFLNKSNNGSLKFSELHDLQAQINRVLYGSAHEGGAPMLKAMADDLVTMDARVGKALNESYTLARTAAKNEILFDTLYTTMKASTDVDKKTFSEILNGARLRAKMRTPMKPSGGKGAYKTPEQRILDSVGPEEGKKIIDDLYALSDYAKNTQGFRDKAKMKVLDQKALTGDAFVGGVSSFLGGPLLGIPVPQGWSLAMTVMLSGPGKKGFLRNFLLNPSHPTLKMGTRLGVQMGGEQLK